MVNTKVQRFVILALIVILGSQTMFASGNKEVADEFGSEVSVELDRIIDAVEAGSMSPAEIQAELNTLREMYVDNDMEEFLQLEALINSVAAGEMNADDALRQSEAILDDDDDDDDD